MNCDNCNPGGGWCEVHQVDKSAVWVKLCQTNPKYRMAWDEGRGPGQAVPKRQRRQKRQGPGTELTAIFANMRVFGNGGCQCKSHASQMDRWGPDVCLARMDTIIGWLREEAEKRRLPFVDAAARIMVRLAIRRARKQEAKE